MGNKVINLRNKEEIEVKIYIDTTDPNDIKVLLDDDESKLDKANLPENIFEIKSKWARVNYSLSTIIEMNQYAEKMVMGKMQKVYDPNMQAIARIRCLLKDWNLNQIDAGLQLQFEPSIENKDVKILSNEAMNKIIGEVHPPTIINYLYNKAMDKVFPEEARQIKKLREMLEDKKA